VVATSAVAGALLLYSLTRTWHTQVWVDSVEVMDGSDALVRLIVLLGLVTGALIVWNVYGGRNWAPLTLTATWVLMVVEWMIVTLASTPSMQREAGMILATMAIATMTVALAAGRPAAS
jgi:hypothetical protein